MSARWTYSVTGMTCAHCIRSVTAEVGRIPGWGRGGAPQARRGRRDRRAAAQPGVRAGRSRRGRLRAGRGRPVTGALGRLAAYSMLLVLVFAVAYALGTALKP